MPFSLDTMTKFKVKNVSTLVSKDRKPEDLPGAQLVITAVLPAGLLAMFDGFLPGMLYRKATPKAQGKLEGLEGEELTEIGSHVKSLPWAYKQTGCTVVIDNGLGDSRSNIELDDCTVHRVVFKPQQGGGVSTTLLIDAPNLSDAVRGKLSGLKASEVPLTIALPEVAQEDLDDEPDTKATRGRKAQTAGEAFAAAHTH